MRLFLRRALRVLAVAALVATALYLRERATFDREAWRADLTQLEAHLTSVYANLDWAVEERGIDLAALHIEAERGLEEARTDAAAQRVIEAFVGRFSDPHLYVARERSAIVQWWLGRGRDLDDLTWETPAKTAVRSMGYARDDLGFRLGFEALPGWEAQPVEGPDPFPAGVLRLASGRRVGILRIASFGTHGFVDVALELFEEQQSQHSGSLDDGAQNDFGWAMMDRLLVHLEDRVRRLNEAEIDALVVDVTQNGGGTDWCDPAARLLTPQPLLAPTLAFPRHEHWERLLERATAAIAMDLERVGLTEEDRTMLETASVRVTELLDQTRQTCDWAPLWTGGPRPDCAPRVRTGWFATGAFGHLPPGVLQDAESRGWVFAPNQWSVNEGVWAGPLYILVDGATASATEYFVAMLRDNEAATVIGSRTVGAGCGYTNGGLPARLERTGIVVKVPDCARYRRDGTNEIEGIVPDVELAQGGSREARAQQVVAALAELVQ